ncbi:SpaA isopeptide-forming pilin-related protein [[Ruminococcus] torques]|uniref:SpaA isopeptide-forming pilin-related protein n=1 Tax=[Ruminococcus] torques TaxID=33039 RepID=UPI0027B94E9F|nr:SpaA isopeptide-forming pilin-related protein [[Ruminococcus] torques]
MREKGKRLIAIILSCLLLLSNVTVYAATEAEEQSDTQNTVSVNASEEVVTLPEEPINGSPGEEAVIQNEPNAEDTSDETETLAPINATDPLEILETPKNMVGIEISSFNFLPTTRSVGIPTVGSTATGTCYIGDTWNVNYPYQDYFYVNNFTGDLTGAVTVQDFECLDPTAALPTHKNASYEATVTEVNAVGGYIEYYVRVTPPGATDGVTRPDGEHLSGYQHVGGKVRVYRAFAGSLELIKSSANQTITNGNSCYSLKGAVYGLYQNGIEIARKTTDVNGYAKFENVTAGNYDLKEITPPKGYALDKRTYPVTINSSQTTRVDVKDYPQSDPVSILLGKVDKDTTQNMPQGSASLEGAEFTIKYYAVHSDKDPAESGKKPVRTWVLKTNKDGKTAMVDSLKVSGDEFFKTSQGYNTLPLGTITIQETKAPKGYLLNEEIFVRQITSKGTTEGVETYNMPTIEEEVIRGDIQLVKYGENNDEPGDSGADIKKPLKDIKFHLTSKTNGDVYTIITDENGFASTKQFGNSERGNLPFDTYTVTEESPYPEYDIIVPFEVTVDEEGKTYSYILRNDTVDAPLSVQKVDKETGKVIPIAGAQFQILDENKKPITMEVHYPTPMVIDTFETDANGSFTLPEKLEHGSYYLHETKAPEGYLLGVEDIPFVVDQEFDWENPLSITYPDAPAKGKIRVTKTDKETDKPIPSGAEFTVTAAEDITTPDGTIRTEKGTVVATLTTDEKGKAETEALYLGKYVIKETKAPNGYLLNPKEFAVTLEYEDQETEIVYGDVTVPDELAKGKIRVKKTDAETGNGLSGAEFEIRAKEDIVTPDGTVKVKAGTVVDTIKTDDKGSAETKVLYLGKYEVQETKAPEGYLLNTQKYPVELIYADQETEIVYGDVTVPDEIAKGKIRITKTDKETNKPIPSGAEFTVTAAEDITTPDGTVRAEKGTVVATLTTDDKGKAETDKLYLGKYVIKETKAPEGYLLNPKEFEVTLAYKDQTTEIVYGDVTVPDQPAKGKIRITKTDAETNKPIPSGAEFTVTAAEDITTPDGTVRAEKGTVVATLTTDDKGKAETDKLYLGKYVIKETKAPEGYLLNPKEFEVTLAYKDQTTEIVYGDVTVPNQPAKGQIEILKKDEETGNLLSGTEFTVTAAEDITTPDGTVRAEKGTVVDTIVTDTTGIARSKELYLGKYVVKETKQPIGFIRPNQTWDVELKYADQKTELVKENLTIKNQPTEIIIDKKETGTDKPLEGVKFVIWNKDKEDPIDPGMQHKEIYTTDKNGKIRLLYLEPGNYAVAEVESIPGYAWDDKMIYEFTITEDGRVDGEVSHTIPVGNDRTEITETNAINVSTGTQDAYAVDLTVIDTVSMVNLMPNREYKLQLILADAKTGEPLKVKDQPSGDLLTTEKTFTADSSKMDVDMQIEFDASPFAGRTIVVYEYLYQDGVEISRHEDLNDKKQQIYVKDKLKLNTTAIDLISGTHEAIAKKDVTIRDNVDHFGLIKGQEYVLKGILMDQTTGKPLVINGKQITAEKSVQIETADGTVPIDFTLDASELNNRSIVVYEYLYHNGQLIASHEDITDEDQTITFKVGSLKPILPPNKGGGLLSALKTGDFSDIMPFAIALIGTGAIILSIVIYNHRKKKKREE